MRKFLAALTGLFLTSFMGSGLGWAGADDLAGSWTVIWSNTSKNDMKLANKNGRFSGSYENDDKESCSLTGNYLASNQHVALQIVCPKWDIRMQVIDSRDRKNTL